MGAADLHVHSTASDGECEPGEVVRRAAAAGLSTIALTDHDSIDGVVAAGAAAGAHGVRVIAGCEFSVAVAWGELHLLAYFLPTASAVLDRFLADQRKGRAARVGEMVRRLNRLGVPLRPSDVRPGVNGGALGRPHVARALVARGVVRDLNGAFEHFLGSGRPAHVPKTLPDLAAVTRLVREVGGVSSAAHLKDRAVRPVLEMLRAAGVDGVEVLHPSHDGRAAKRIEALAGALDLLPTGGSDWHGDGAAGPARARLGEVRVSDAWLEGLERVHRGRRERLEAVS